MTAFSIVGFIIGSVLGSFSKALAERSLNRKSFFGRSVCNSCNKPLSWFDLIPVFSYLLLRGRCRYCKKKMGREYLIVELVFGAILSFIFWQASPSFPPLDLSFAAINFFITLLLKIFFITVLVIVTLTDLKKMIIPDRIILPAVGMLLAAQLFIAIYKVGYLYSYLNSSAIGKLLLPPHSEYFTRHALMVVQQFGVQVLSGLAIAGFFMALIIITRGKGMGGGDVKMGAFIGLMLGFPNSLLAVMLAFFSGAIVALVMIVMGKKRFGQSLPFGPFLVLGSLIALFWGDYLIKLYLNI